MTTEEEYYVVTLKVFAFETQEKADKYAAALLDAFMEMPESETYASSVRVTKET